MTDKQYVNVSEFIQNSGVLRYDGSHYYHDDLFAYAYPTGGVLKLRFLGEPDGFGVNSIPAAEALIPSVPSDTIRKIGLIGRTLVILNTNNEISFYRAGSASGNDTTYINSEFSDVLAADGIIDFDTQAVSGDDASAGAVFITTDGKPIFYRVPFPGDIDALMSGKFANKIAVDNDKNFCLGFSDYSIIYYNGYSFDDSSYRLISTDVITSESYETDGYETSPKESPNELTDVRQVVAHSGFSVLTGNGRVVVWGGNLQPINDNDSGYINPSIQSNIASIYTSNDYGIALTSLGGAMVWGGQQDRLDDIESETRQIHAVTLAPEGFVYTVDRGRTVVLGTDESGVLYNSITFASDLNTFKDEYRYMHTMVFGDNYSIAYTEHINESFDPVRVDFKMIQRDGEYYIPLSDYFPFDLAGLRLETFNRIEQSSGTLGRNMKFSIDDNYVSIDGNPDRSKVIVSPIDLDNNGVPDDPFAFKQIVGDNDFIFLETFIDTDGSESTRIARDVKNMSDIAFFAPGQIVYADISRNFTDVYGESHTYESGRFYRGVDNINNVVVNRGEELSMGFDGDGGKKYSIENGRGYNASEPFMFQWNHFATGGGDIIDPSISNLMDMYILTSSYDIAVRRWLRADGNMETMPQPPTTEELRSMIRFIEPNKSTSDQLVYIPARYCILFGESARPEHQSIFNVVKASGATMSDNEIKSRVITAINDYFDIDNWDFGDKFYFSELSGFIHNRLVGEVASVVIVPRFRDASFGDLYQIHSEPNELFLSSATVEDVVINPHYTSQNMRRG